MTRPISLLLATFTLLIVGCHKEIDVTQQNLTGSWRAPFGDAVLTIHLLGDSTFYMETSQEGTQGSQLYLVSAWGRLPYGGTWRIGDREIIFGGGEAGTTGGLEIVALYEDHAIFQADDGSRMSFDKLSTAPAAAPALPPAGAGEDDEGDDEADAEEGMPADDTEMPEDEDSVPEGA